MFATPFIIGIILVLVVVACQDLVPVLIATGGISANLQLTNSTETYVLGKNDTKRWSSCAVPEMPGPARAYHAGFVLPNGPNPIFGLCGGIVSAIQISAKVPSVVGLTSSCLTLDLQGNKWTNETIPPMIWPRYGHAIAVDSEDGGNSLVYALGGWVDDRDTPTYKFEVYDQSANKWYVLREYPVRVADHAMVFDPRSKYLFSTGGTDGQARYYVRTYRYDPSTDSWTRMAPLNKRRKGHALCLTPWAGEYSFYAVGGHDGSDYLDSIERYDIQSNKWTLMDDFKLSRPVAYFGLVPTHFYSSPGFAVVGGVTSKGRTEDGLIEFTSVVTHESLDGWQNVAELTQGRSHLSLIILNVPQDSSLAQSSPDTDDTLRLGCHPPQPGSAHRAVLSAGFLICMLAVSVMYYHSI